MAAFPPTPGIRPEPSVNPQQAIWPPEGPHRGVTPPEGRVPLFDEPTRQRQSALLWGLHARTAPYLLAVSLLYFRIKNRPQGFAPRNANNRHAKPQRISRRCGTGSPQPRKRPGTNHDRYQLWLQGCSSLPACLCKSLPSQQPDTFRGLFACRFLLGNQRIRALTPYRDTRCQTACSIACRTAIQNQNT